MIRISCQMKFGLPLTGHMTEISSFSCGNIRPTERRLRAKVPSQQNTITFQYASFWKEHEVKNVLEIEDIYTCARSFKLPLKMSLCPSLLNAIRVPVILTPLCKCCTISINKLHSRKVQLLIRNAITGRHTYHKIWKTNVSLKECWNFGVSFCSRHQVLALESAVDRFTPGVEHTVGWLFPSSPEERIESEKEESILPFSIFKTLPHEEHTRGQKEDCSKFKLYKESLQWCINQHLKVIITHGFN